MPAAIQYQVGQRFPNTRLTYQGEAPKQGKVRVAFFECDCGNIIERPIAWVRHLNTTSCGCYRSELVTDTNTKHSQAVRGNQTGAYRSWAAMHQRAGIHPNYLHVSVCSRWSGSQGFENFFADMGPRPKDHTIERLDGSKDYEPSNCVWASRQTQATNSSNSKFITINGVQNTISGWCKHYGISYARVKQRQSRQGMDLITALTTPINTSKQRR